MRMLLNRRLHINMGNYEHIESVATVEVNTETDAEVLAELGVDARKPGEIRDFINKQTKALVEKDVEDGHFLTDERRSFAHEYYEENYKEK